MRYGALLLESSQRLMHALYTESQTVLLPEEALNCTQGKGRSPSQDSQDNLAGRAVVNPGECKLFSTSCHSSTCRLKPHYTHNSAE